MALALLLLFMMTSRDLLAGCQEINTNNGWANTTTPVRVPCNLLTTPLQLETTRDSSGKVQVEFTASGLLAGVVDIHLSDPPQVSISPCTESPLRLANASHLGGAETVVWTLEKNTTLLVITRNDVVSLEYAYSTSKDTKCAERWSVGTDVATIDSTYTTDTVEYRLKPATCKGLEEHWRPYMKADVTFPVHDGKSFQVTCNPGYANIGDARLKCNTNLYTDLQYKKEPWCVGPITGGSVEVESGTAATLTCTLTHCPQSHAPLKMRWSAHGEVISDAVEGSVTDGEQVSTLTVESPVRDAVYTCRVDDTSGSETVAAEVNLDVFKMEHVSKDVLSGDTATLSCIMEGMSEMPRVVWKRGSAVLDSGGGYKIATVTDATQVVTTLQIEEARDDDSFTCEVTSGHYPGSEPAVRVLTLNTFLIKGVCLSHDADRAVLFCEIRNISDEMNITWWRGDEPLPAALGPIQSGLQRSVLFVKPNSDLDAYTCRVTSIVNDKSKVQELRVHLTSIKPSPTNHTNIALISTLGCVAGLLSVAVAVLTTYIVKQHRRVGKMSLRVSTREKLDSISTSHTSIYQNRAAPEKRDVESLRRTLDRRWSKGTELQEFVEAQPLRDSGVGLGVMQNVET